MNLNSDSCSTPGFGDTVRIRHTTETAQAGIAGREGTVYGFTTPSVTGVEVVGELMDDFALNVHVEALDAAFWLDPSNIELVSRPDTQVLTVGNKRIVVTRTEDGYQEDIEDLIPPRPWWRFW